MNYVMPEWSVWALAGAGGQLMRAAVGIKKAIDRGEAIHIGRVFWSTVYAMGVGALLGYFTKDWRIAFTSSYATTDLSEGLIKVIRATPSPSE